MAHLSHPVSHRNLPSTVASCSREILSDRKQARRWRSKSTKDVSTQLRTRRRSKRKTGWISSYQCIRFSVEGSSESSLECKSVYRRQHKEGPINDLWTDLTLQTDKCNNQLIIVEARKEWRGGGSTQTRTFYTTRMSLALNESASTSNPELMSVADESMAVTLGSRMSLPSVLNSLPLRSDKNDIRHPTPNSRRHRDAHPEYGCSDDHVISYILTRTKFRAYSLSCHASLDLVEDTS